MSAVSDQGNDAWTNHRDRTRRAIVDAFLALIVEENPATISMPEVARRAGVSIRTLYRYVPNKDALVHAASTHLDAELDAVVGETTDVDTLDAYLVALWSRLAANVPAIRVQQSNVHGREVRRKRLEIRRREVEALLDGRIEQERLADTVDLVIATMSSSMMLELVDRMGHSPEHAAALASRVVRLILDDTTDPPVTSESTPHRPPHHHTGGLP